jgi:O-antigen/teichoic acid export membrane protein
MNTVQIIAKNTGSLILMNIITLFLMMLFNITIARFLGDNVLGIYSFAIALTSLLSIIIDQGFNQLSIKNMSRNKNIIAKYIVNIIIIKTIFSILYICLIIFILHYYNYPAVTKNIVYILTIYSIFVSFSKTFESIFRVIQKMEYISFFSIIERFIIVFMGIYLIYLDLSLINIISIFIVGGSIKLFLNIKYTKEYYLFNIKEFNIHYSKNLIINGLPIALFSIFMIVNYRVDTIMLSIITTNSTVGWYNAAYNLIFGLSFIATSLIGSLFPILSKKSIISKKSIKIIYKKGMKYLLIISLPIAFGTTILANDIIYIIYGNEFNNSIVILQILIWSIIPMFLYNLLGSIIMSLDEEKKAVYFWGICALINVILNVILIPMYTYIGASLTTIISELLLFLLFYLFISKYYFYVSIIKILYKPLIASIIMVIYIYNFININLFILIMSSMILYFILLIITKTFSNTDKKIIKELINRN